MALLGQDACELFGRFFISLLVQATQRRTADTAVYCYIDECQDYIANDENIALLLDKARKQKVGFVFAHQRLANIKSPNVLDALSNTAIKCAARTDTDAATLARYMRTTPDFISNQKKLAFAVFARDATSRALSIQVEYGLMENMERMTVDEEREIRQRMRERYCVSPSSTAASPPSSSASERPVPDSEWEDVV
jgi:hypothetical protein